MKRYRLIQMNARYLNVEWLSRRGVFTPNWRVGFRVWNVALLAALSFPLIAAPRVARAQGRPYIGYVYPAGGQQGSTFRVKLGGQAMDDADGVIVTGEGVTAKVLEYNRVLNPQEMQLLNEQLRELKRGAAKETQGTAPMMEEDSMMLPAAGVNKTGDKGAHPRELVARIEKRIAEYVNRPASAALASILYAEVTIASNASPGERELRVATLRGISNPLTFHVGQVPETCRKPMRTAAYQVLGKEELALRRRPTNEVEVRVILPCTVNGQVASGEQNRYRFNAQKGQRIVISLLARQLIPYIADAVPGWFQPVLAIYDSAGREVAYGDDYRFKPDPTVLVEIPKDDEYVVAIYDAIYRGREDFVYRATIGELPFITSIFPLGARAGDAAKIKMSGWNLGRSEVEGPGTNEGPGLHRISCSAGKLASNHVPFELGALPECMEKEGNNSPKSAQKIKLPTVVNGRIGWADDWDVFQFQGRSGERIVADVRARRLDSPLDSVLKLTDAAGNVLALNDDNEDLGSGLNTHHADSHLAATLPSDGAYFIHIGDNSRSGGEEYGYRLRVSPPQPDFALRTVPSSLALRAGGSGTIVVHAIREDGCTNAIKIGLKEPPPGFSAPPVFISGTQTVARLNVKVSAKPTDGPITLTIAGTAKIQGREVTHAAVPSEDRMQAFLWRHLVPAKEFSALVFDPSDEPLRKRARRKRPQPLATASTNGPATNVVMSTNAVANKPKFTKAQVAGRIRQLNLLFEEGLLTDAFYAEKIAECDALK